MKWKGGLPALFGVEGIEELTNGDMVCMDAGEGNIVINPNGITSDESAWKNYRTPAM